MLVTSNTIRSWQHTLKQGLASLKTLGIVGWPLVVVLGFCAIIICWVPYVILKFGDNAIDLVREPLKSIAVALIRELNGTIHHPAAQLERALLIVLLVACFLFSVLWISSRLLEVEGATFLIFASSFFLVFIITAIKSGDIAKHLL
jgi:hypothetical protein